MIMFGASPSSPGITVYTDTSQTNAECNELINEPPSGGIKHTEKFINDVDVIIYFLASIFEA